MDVYTKLYVELYIDACIIFYWHLCPTKQGGFLLHAKINEQYENIQINNY